eukprot:Gb_15771 [translate_table: standard]
METPTSQRQATLVTTPSVTTTTPTLVQMNFHSIGDNIGIKFRLDDFLLDLSKLVLVNFCLSLHLLLNRFDLRFIVFKEANGFVTSPLGLNVALLSLLVLRR